MSHASLLDTALHYAQQFGWAVHPVNIKKKPITEHGRNDATTEESVIRRMFHNGAQIGVATGTESGLFVFDVDYDEKRGINGYETLEYLEATYGKLPLTPHQRTGRGGTQYLFRYVDGLKNSASAKEIGAGIDTRGAGGYIVIAPSHNTNGPYEWIASPDDTPLADVPEWLVTLLKKPKQTTPAGTTTATGDDRAYCLKMLGQAVARCATAADGTKHDTLLKMATWMGGFVPAISDLEIENALFSAVALVADDPDGARKTIRDGIAYGKTRPLNVPPLRTASVRTDVNPATGEVIAKPPVEYIPGPQEDPESQQIIDRLKLMGYSFRLNLCTDSIEVNGTKISDVMAAEIRTALRDIGLSKKIAAAEDAYVSYAKKDAYHPIHDYLNNLKWDGHDHIGQLTSCMDSSDPPIVYQDGTIVPQHAVYIYRWLIGAVAKALDAQQLMMLVLDGVTKLGKSTLCAWLCGGMPDYFIESSINPSDKDTDVRLIDRWIWEVAELDATTRKADQSALKSFITKRHVTVRKSYGRYDITKPALACLIGTVNNSTGFLKDDTGNRRFMITCLTRLDFSYEMIDVNQLWAQAVHLYRNGEPWKLVGEEEEAQNDTNKRYEEETTMADWLDYYFDFDPELSSTEWSLADLLIVMAAEYKPTGTEAKQTAELSRILRSKGATKKHGRTGNRWVGISRRRESL